jgi:ParB family chromosome partitioning protein
MLLARQRRPGFRMFRLNGLMLGRGSHDAGLIRLVWMNLLRQFGKKALSSRFCCVQPPDKPSRYQLVAGERRWRAAQLAKIHQVPAIIRELTDAECYEIALIENIQRSDLSVIEESQGYQKLLETNRYTQDQLSDIIGKSRSHIANLLRLLLLPPSVQSLLLERKITMGQARPLIGHDQAEALAKMIVAKGLSARQAEALAKQPAGKAGQKSRPPEKSADIKALEKQAAEKLGLAFHIDWNEAKDRGKGHH